MTTRTYYLPRNRIALHVINSIIDNIGCSIGEIKVSAKLDCIKVPITCANQDIFKVEKILKCYDMLG